MAKGKSIDKSVINAMAAVLAFLSIMVFGVIPMVETNSTIPGISTTRTLYKGFSMIFGGTTNSECRITNLVTSDTTIQLIKVPVSFNLIAFIATMLVSIGVVISFAISYVKELKNNKLYGIVAGALVIAGGIFMLLVKNSTIDALSMNELASSFSLAHGVIISSVATFVSGLTLIVCQILKK